MKLPDEFRRPIAHRGLHDGCGPEADGKVFENTLTAFEAAIATGFGIECDVRAAAGGLPVVFHDATVPDGLPFARRSVSSISQEEIGRFRYIDGSPLLTFSEFLKAVSGRAPVLAELKFDGKPADPAFLTAIADAASGYGGPLALMSFEPLPLFQLMKLLPQVPRGLVAKWFDEDPTSVARLGPDEALRRSRASDLEAIGGSFVAYELSGLASLPPGHLKLAQDDMIFTWTVRSADDLELAQKLADAPICEGEAAKLLMRRQAH